MIRHHGLIPIPVDIDPKTLAPKRIQLQRALKRPRAVLFLAAHLYGRRIDLSECLDILQEGSTPLIEDCAESFGGVGFTGHQEAEMSLFSFGGIKVATAFGGGIATVRNPGVLNEMRALQGSYAVQSRWDYLKRVIKYSAVAIPLNVPAINVGVRRACVPFGIDHKSYAVGMVRGFPDRLMERLRESPCCALLDMLYRQLSMSIYCNNLDSTPCCALLDMLYRQLSNYRMSQHQTQTDVGSFVETGLPLASGFTVPGGEAFVKEYWLFPVLVQDPEAVLRELARHGVDAYQGATQLALVEPPEGFPDYPEEAARMMEKVIYLPVHRRVPLKDANTLLTIVDKIGNPKGGRAKGGVEGGAHNARL